MKPTLKNFLPIAAAAFGLAAMPAMADDSQQEPHVRNQDALCLNVKEIVGKCDRKLDGDLNLARQKLKKVVDEIRANPDLVLESNPEVSLYNSSYYNIGITDLIGRCLNTPSVENVNEIQRLRESLQSQLTARGCNLLPYVELEK